MIRKISLGWHSVTLLPILLAAYLAVPAVAEENSSEIAIRPNFVWIMSEDNSKHYLRHFDADGAAAPNIEALAEHGITFDRAFSCAPVCSVARTTLITSCYAPRIGTQFHRRSRLAVMPSGVEMFPTYLRRAGYYTTNNSKEDYNAQAESPWDESSKRASWKNRPSANTSFFHVATFTDSHESSLHVDVEIAKNKPTTDPDSINLQPYFPDTSLFRQTRARYHDRMKIIDDRVGEVVADLKAGGELENTFIFFFGDHGGVLPRSKGYLYESGLHVPLVVRVPQKFRDLTSRELASRTTGFVEFVDFGPTVLSLAGMELPQGIDGKAFLGKASNVEAVDSRNETIGYADRFDEKYELVRTLRQGRWKYHRNFEAYLPDGLQNNYRYKMPAYSQWRELYHSGKLDEVRSAFFEPKPVESLYDLESDPHEIHNLANAPEHQDVLVRLRERLNSRLKSMPDLSFFPEAVLYEQAMSNPVEFGQRHSSRIAALLDTANLALLPLDRAEPGLREALVADDPWQRLWAVIACGCFGERASPLLSILQERLADDESLVAARAAEVLAIVNGFDPREVLYRAVSSAKNEPEALQIMNTVVFVDSLQIDGQPVDPKRIEFGFNPPKASELGGRLQYLNREGR